MKDQERSDKIKKLLIILLISITSFNFVKAEETTREYPDITDDIEIRYKWYKEIISEEGEYYPLKDITPEDKIDENNIKYVSYNIFNPEHCSLPSEYYAINQEYIRRYRKTYNASYVLIENINSSDNIKIYYDNKPVNFKVMSTEDNKIKINLRKEYLCDKLLFYVDTDEKYKISIYMDLLFERIILSKELENTKISVPDKTWITEATEFYTYVNTIELAESDFTTLISEQLSCSYKEKYVYKYNVTKEYYDDNYHLNIDGYVKDENDYRFFYKGEPITITNTVEVIKEQIIKEPQIEYIYIEKENNAIENNDTEKNDSSKEKDCLPEIKTEIKTKIVEKEVSKVPKKLYVIIFILALLILFLTIKLYKKYVD